MINWLMQDRRRLLAAVAILSWIGFQLWALERYPTPTCDEAHYSAAAFSVLKAGKFGIPFFANLVGVGDSFIAYGRLVLLGQAIVQFFFGPTLLSARLFSLLGTGVLTAATYGLATTLYDRRVGLWAAILVAADWAVFMQSHSGRPDIWTTAASFSGLYLVFWLARNPAMWRAVLTGFVAALLQDIHLNGVHFILGISLVAAYVLLVEQKQWKLFAAYGLGGLLGACYFVVVHLFPDPALAIRQYQTLLVGAQYAAWADVPLADRMLDLLRWAFSNYVNNFSGLGWLLAAFYGPGVLLAFLCPERRSSIFLLVFTLASWLSFGLVNIHKPDYYAVIWRPGLVILGTAGLVWFAQRPRLTSRLPRLFQARAITVMLGLLFAGLIAGNVYLAVKFRAVNYKTYANELRLLVPVQARVMADDLWWYALYDRELVATNYLLWTQYVRHRPIGDLEMMRQDFTTLRFDYAVLDAFITCSTQAEHVSGMLKEVVEERCDPIGSVSGAWFDPSTVYRCK